jgi:hypothetical protein
MEIAMTHVLERGNPFAIDAPYYAIHEPWTVSIHAPQGSKFIVDIALTPPTRHTHIISQCTGQLQKPMIMM